MPLIGQKENREMIDHFIKSGERLRTKLKKFLKACETLMLEAGRRGNDKVQLRKNEGVEFADYRYVRKRRAT